MAPPTRKLRDDEIKTKNAQETETAIPEKDQVELQLENLLFGDEAGFLNSLTASTGHAEASLARLTNDENGIDSENAEDAEMEDLPDDELFFLDAGTEGLSQGIVQELEDEDETIEYHNKQPLWVDSDDERITVSLASNTRLRKLRDTENDDIVSGTEYVRRLRRQYERLHPVPDWVKYAYKKRKLSNGEARSESDSEYSIDDQPALSSIPSLSELLREGGGFVRNDPKTIQNRQNRRLRPEVIDIQRLKDVASSGPSSIDTLQFHPHHPLLLSGGPSATINLYHISPQPPNPNPLVTSLHLKNTPLHTAAFCLASLPSDLESDSRPDSTRVFISSRRKYFHTWSLSTGMIQKVSRPIYGSRQHEQKTMESFKLSPCGRYMGLVGSAKKGGGVINVLSTETMQWICACRVDSQGGVADFDWWADGNGFAAVGKNGEVSEYDVEEKRVLYRWLDDGAVGTTVIALGGSDQSATRQNGLNSSRWVAIGSSSGIVNIYDRREWSAAFGDNNKNNNNNNDNNDTKTLRPKPTRSLDQLTTPTSHLEFSGDGQMLVVGSRWKRNALRLVHLPSCTVYRNWPTDRTPLGRVSSVALSKSGGFLAVGNEQGKIRLFQIRD